jgi:hypothetical protein
MKEKTVKKLIFITPDQFEKYKNSIFLPQNISNEEKNILTIIQNPKLNSTQKLFLMHNIVNKIWLKNHKRVKDKKIENRDGFTQTNQNNFLNNEGTQTNLVRKYSKETSTTPSLKPYKTPPKRISSTPEENYDPILQQSFEHNKSKRKIEFLPEEIYSNDDDEINLSLAQKELMQNIRRESGVEDIDVNNLLIRHLDDASKDYVDIQSRSGSWSSSASKPKSLIQLSPTKTRRGTIRAPLERKVEWRNLTEKEFNKMILDSYKKPKK